MRKLFLLLVAVIFSVYLPAQTIVAFHEDFELPSSGDSVTSSTDPIGGIQWTQTTTLKNSGTYSDSIKVQTGTTVYLTTNSFSTIGKTKVYLQFAQICKLLFNDGGSVDVSIDGGTTWVGLTPTEYRGTGTLISGGGIYKFSESAYNDWLSGDTLTKPTNAWWKNELFEISTIAANQANVKVRFKFYGSGAAGSTGRYGWLIDDIKVTAANNEIFAPKITFVPPIHKDSVYITGPISISAWVKDSSAIASVNLIYTVNGGSPITLAMTNVSDSLYRADLGSFPYSTVICYSVQAADIYNNVGTLPVAACQQFVITQGNPNILVGTGTLSGATTPIYTTTTTGPYYSYYATILTKSQIASGGTIESIAFNKMDANGYSLNNGVMRVYAKTVADSIAPSTWTAYAAARTSATKIYESTTQNLNVTAGWQTFTCNTGLPFQYSGSDHLLLFVEFYHPGALTGVANFQYATVANQASSFYGAAAVPTTTTLSNKANIKINFETSTQAIDTKVASFTNPGGGTTVIANTSIPVSVKIKNLGTTAITSANVGWAVDGVYQTSVPWSVTTGLLQGYTSSSSLTLGNFNFPLGPHTIKAWTNMPNNLVDQNTANDTLTINIYSCQNLNGIVTVGDVTSTYPTFNDLFTALGNCGINGPLTVKVKTGTYNQQLTIPYISNVSATNTITFQSESGNQADVIFNYTATGTADNWVLKFDGSQYIKVKNMTFKTTGATYGYIAVFANAASYNTIEGCRLEMPTTTTTTVAGVYNASTYNENYNTIKNNTIVNGYYGIYFYGTSSTVKEIGNVFNGNTITGFYYYGIDSYYQDSITMIGNTITNGSNASYAYGIYSYYGSNLTYLKNKIALNATYNYCMYLYYSNNVAGTGLVANNMISQATGTSTTYGMYCYSSNNLNIYNNSVNVTGAYTSNYAFYIYAGSNNNIVNNIFSNTGGGYAYYGSSTTGINISNYNCLYKTGTNLAYWGGAMTTLAALQTASGKDQNSISINPQFIAWNNLHINNSYLFNLAAKGTSLPQVTDDFDGETRSAIPFIGADEFPFPQNDAGIVAITQPPTMLPTLTQDIKVTIQNIGQSPLTSVTLKCLVNGLLLPGATYSNTTGLAQFGVDSLVVATAYTFPAGYSQIKVYTESPNNVPDTYNANDTLYKSVYACTGTLSGNYTIGGTGANYPSVDAAIVSLQCGISGPVVFNINPGTYTGSYVLPNVTGATASNTITFKSANNDSTGVILQYNAAGTADNFILNFNNVSNYIFKGIYLKALNTTNANVITLAGTLSNISIQNSILEGTQSTNTDDNQVLIRCSALTQITGFNLLSNRMNYGRMAINFTSTNASTAVVMKYNYMFNQSQRPMNLAKIDALDFGNNNLFSDATKTSNGGIFTNALTGAFKFYNNTLINLGGVRVWEGWTYGGTTAGSEALVYNNYLYGGSATLSYVYDGGGAVNNIKFYHNTYVGNTTNTVINFNNYYGANANITFKNNILYSNGKLVNYTAQPTAPFVTDYNDYYSTGATWATFWATTATNLATVKTASAQESHSVSVNPQFVSVADYHITNYALKGLANPVPEVTTDIDGQARSLTAPDMGCDELMVYSNDASIASFGSGTICPGNTNIVVKLKNFGSNAITTVNVNWSINGVVQTPVAYTGSLVTLADSNIFLGTYNFLSMTPYNLKFWSSSPNGTNDGNTANDTLSFNNMYTGLAGGTYTVGDVTSDFLDVTAAVNFISSNGICGPVVFNIKPGTYTGRYTIPSILGSSAVNTVTFKSLNNDSTSVILTATATGTADNWIIKLSGAKYITLKNLKFTPLSTTYANAILVNNTSKFNTIVGNYLVSTAVASGFDVSLIRIDDNNSSDNVITGNHTVGGGSGILIRGSSTTARIDRILISKNIIEGYAQWGIRSEYANSPVIDSNVMTSNVSLIEKHGVSLSYNYDTIVVSRNTIYLTNYTNLRGIDMGNCTSTATTKSLLKNNFITLNGATGSTNTYGIRLYPLTTYCRVLNNSINVVGTNLTDTRGINPAGTSTNIEVINNNVVCNYYPSFYENTVVTYADYNNYYSTTSIYAYNNGTSNLTYASQALLNAATLKDTNTLSMDPQFTSFTDLHTNNISLYAMGKPLAQVTNDIDNQPRAAIPCIGADEFTVLPNDAKLRAVYTLGSLPKTAGSPHNVKAIVKNVGSTVLTNVVATLNISGSNSFTNTKTIASMIIGRQDTITFDPFTPTNFGTNNVTVTLNTDSDTTNNQLSYYQNVTDTVFGYADTTKAATNFGFGTAAGKMYAKYYVNTTKIMHSISAFITKDNTIGKQVYAVVLNSNGVAVDSSSVKTLAASDTNTWVTFNLLNPPATSTGNNYFYAGIAQIANASAFNPVGSQKETPARGNAYFTSALNGSSLTDRQDIGRLMINVNFGAPTNKDAAMISINSPNTNCGLSTEQVNVIIQNKGLDTIYGGQNVLSVNYGLRFNGNLINVVSQAVTDTIIPSATKNITFNVPLNVVTNMVDSNYHLLAWVKLTNDPFASNDTLYKDFTAKYTPNAPVANNVSVAYGYPATLTAVSNDTINWYHQAVGGTKLAAGASYTTPYLYASDTLWAEAITKFAVNAPVGTGTVVNTTTSYPCPYGQFYTGSKEQYLITKAELNAIGIFAGPISSIGFDVVSVPGAALVNYTIKIAHTNLAALTTSYITGLTQVYTIASLMPTTGWNVYNFSTPFVWNGIDNIVIENCFDNYAGASNYTTNAVVNQSTTSFVSATNYRSDGGGVCPTATATYTFSQRPNMKIAYNKDGCSSARTKVVVTVAAPPANEVGMVAFTSPTGPVPSNTTTPIKVKVKNTGLLPLTSVKVNYVVNSVLQPQYSWTNTTTPLQHDSIMELTIGSFNLPGGLDTIIAWTSNPNNVTDPYPLNDTAKIFFSTCMSGNYTIGVGKNFPTFTAALTAVTMAGVCGNTVFLADSGLYEERLFLNPIPGVGPNAKVTFTSAMGDSTKVTLHYTLSSAAAWAMKFIGSSYITFTKMKLSISNSNTWGRIMELAPNANHIEISNCIIEGMQGTTNNYSLIYMGGTGINYNTIKNNVMLNGYQVIYNYGASGNLNKMNTISNNNLIDFYYYGIYNYYQDSLTCIGNTIQNISSSSYAYAFYSAYCSNFNYQKNKINVNATYNYPMYLYYSNNTSGTGLVANNFISQSVGTSTTYGMYVYYSNNLNIYYNSVNITGAYTSNYAFYIYAGSNNNIVNNIFSNTGGGYAYYASSTTGVNTSNYNDLYATGTTLGYWGAACTNLAAFQTASGREQNSLSVNPNFFSLTDLHMVNFLIDKKGTPVTGVTDDIDGDVRNATLPDIGADEFNLPNNDAGAYALISPVNPATAGIQAIKVSIKDWGVLNLTSAIINWSVNGVTQIPFTWTGNLVSGALDSVVVGNYNLVAGQTCFKFWTTLPNGVADQLTINDTINTCITVCNGALNGTYTIGGVSANYQNFNGAVQAMQMCGISGPVTFNVAPGTYTEQFAIGAITGSSATNTVTFKSANGDSTSVVLGFNFTVTNNNYVVQFNAGAQYITIKGITIRQTNTSSGRVINFTGSPSNITIANNRIEMPFNSAGTTAGIVTLSSDFGNDNKILNNNISTGYNGIVAQGSATVPALRTLIKGNIISGYYYYGIQCTYLNSPVIDSNTVISTVSGSGQRVGIYMSSVTDSMKVTRNSIILSNSTNTNGIQLETFTGTATSKGLVANNFVSILNGASYTYALRLYPAINYVIIAHNSIYVNGTSTTDTRGINVVAGGNVEVYNNNVVSKYFPTLYEGNLAPISGSNYNNFYSLSGTYAYYNGTSILTYPTLAALNAVIHMDTNSVSVDPDFYSTTNLHVYTSAVNNLAKPLSYVTNDIDGQPRSATTPDIGADEYSPLQFDLATTVFLEPGLAYMQAGGNINVKAIIKNYGADSVANFNVVCKFGNAAPVNFLHTNYLLANKQDTITFTNLPVVAGPSVIKVYTDLTTDLNHNNDTIKMNYFGMPIKNIPYAENFDNTVTEWFSPNTNTLWEKGVPTASVINTAHSAPNVWATKLNGNYNNNMSDTLYTPIFNNSVFKADTLKFWHWVDAELNKDGGRIEFSSDGGLTWAVLGHVSPPVDTSATNWYNGSTQPMWTGTGAGWQQSKYRVYNLAGLGNTLQFRYLFTSDAANTNNGWAIDDFELTLAPIPQDGGVTAITSPASTVLVGDLVNVTITVKNFGTDTLTNIPVKYQVGSGTVYSATIAGSLAPGTTTSYTFAQQYQVTNTSFSICAYTNITGDIYTQNDQTCKSVTVNPAQNDVGITEITDPSGYVSSNSQVPIKVKIKNFGTQAQTSIPVYYQRGFQPPVSATWTGNLAAFDSIIYTFPVLMTVPIGSSISLCAWTRLTNDAYSHNDSACKSVNICPVGAAGTITGPTTVAMTTTQTYSISVISNAISYNWVITPSGAGSIVNNGTSANVTFNIGFTAAVISVNGVGATCSGNASTQNIIVYDGVDDIDAANFWLSQNVPNPTNGLTSIEYCLPTAGEVKFDIMNLFGQKLISSAEKHDAGKHLINLNTNDLANGVYYYTIEFKGKRLVKKMVVNK
ncbi:MAG: right-handed parallel beta-helix repeat-containing protein [Bacteroidetes bacterium]|nr:right-handed parallel beta-helix repeat-containing protein [Bacteroidota bacterium]